MFKQKEIPSPIKSKKSAPAKKLTRVMTMTGIETAKKRLSSTNKKRMSEIDTLTDNEN